MGELATKRDYADAIEKFAEVTREVTRNLLTAFHAYAQGEEPRLQALEVRRAAINQRLAALEERVLNLETRRGPGAH